MNRSTISTMNLTASGKSPEQFLNEADASWRRLEDGLAADYPKLYGIVGLARFKFKGETLFIGRSVEYQRGALCKYLKTLGSARDQTGNQYFGARTIRGYGDDIDVEVLEVGRGWKAAELTKNLKRKMIKRHRPKLNQNIAKRIAEQADD